MCPDPGLVSVRSGPVQGTQVFGLLAGLYNCHVPLGSIGVFGFLLTLKSRDLWGFSKVLKIKPTAELDVGDKHTHTHTPHTHTYKS